MDRRLRASQRAYVEHPCPETLHRYNTARVLAGLDAFLPIEHLQMLFVEIKKLLGNPEIRETTYGVDTELDFYGTYSGVDYSVMGYNLFGSEHRNANLEITKGDPVKECMHEITIYADDVIYLNSDCPNPDGSSNDYFGQLPLNQPWVYSIEDLMEFTMLHWDEVDLNYGIILER